MKRALTWDRGLWTFILVAIFVLFGLFLVLPLFAILLLSFAPDNDHGVGLHHFRAFLQSERLLTSALNTLVVGIASTILTILLAWPFAYILGRRWLPWRGVWRTVALLPLSTPSLMIALSLIFLLGNNGLLSQWLANVFSLSLGSFSIYGVVGIILAESFFCFPFALLILQTGYRNLDQSRLDAARSCGAGEFRIGLTVTWPVLKSSLLGASVLVFTLVITDFGIPKLIGGRFSVLSTEIYDYVIAGSDFSTGAVVAFLLLIPAALLFILDQRVNASQRRLLGDQPVPPVRLPRNRWDILWSGYAITIAIIMLLLFVVVALAAFSTVWPSDLSLTLNNFDFKIRYASESLVTSTLVSLAAAVSGAVLILFTAYSVERGRAPSWIRKFLHALSMLPLAVPGLILGIGYIIFFNDPDNPLNWIYNSFIILVAINVTHYFSVGYVALGRAVASLDPNMEAVSRSMRVNRTRYFLKVVVPTLLPSLLNVALYMFITSMVTISAVIFVISPGLEMASLAIIKLDDAGEVSQAAAMAVLITAICLTARAGVYLLQRKVKG